MVAPTPGRDHRGISEPIDSASSAPDPGATRLDPGAPAPGRETPSWGPPDQDGWALCMPPWMSGRWRAGRRHEQHRGFPRRPHGWGPCRRSAEDRLFGGVAGGLSKRTGIDATIFRIGFVLVALAGGFGAAVYLVLWLVLPVQGTTGSIATRATRDLPRDHALDLVPAAVRVVRGAGPRARRRLPELLRVAALRVRRRDGPHLAQLRRRREGVAPPRDQPGARVGRAGHPSSPHARPAVPVRRGTAGRRGGHPGDRPSEPGGAPAPRRGAPGRRRVRRSVRAMVVAARARPGGRASGAGAGARTAPTWRRGCTTRSSRPWP